MTLNFSENPKWYVLWQWKLPYPTQILSDTNSMFRWWSNLKTLPGGVITEEEIEKIIRGSIWKKVRYGPDKIQNKHSIHGGKIVVKTLTLLFNCIVNKSYVPKQWKKGWIFPIYKGGNKVKSSPYSYRPVCLLSCLLKVFERLFLPRLQSHILTSDIFINPLQQGFHSGFWCLTVCGFFLFYEPIFHNIESHSGVYCAFLDSRKGFDTVWRKAIMYKLFKLSVRGKACCIIDTPIL